MFDEDPGSVKQGEAHWIMSYMRAWRPTFIYVRRQFAAQTNWHDISSGTDRCLERIHSATRAMGCLGPWHGGWLLSQCSRMERGTCIALKHWIGTGGAQKTYHHQFATGLIRSCRARDTKTPFLQTALNGNDAFLGRPLTDSELAEESMGGMFGGSGTTANTFVYLLWATLRQPDVVKKLKQELHEAFPKSDGSVPDAAVRSFQSVQIAEQ